MYSAAVAIARAIQSSVNDRGEGVGATVLPARVNNMAYAAGDKVMFAGAKHTCVHAGISAAQVPVSIAPLLNPEIISDPQFNNVALWSTQPGWAVAGGLATHTAGASGELRYAYAALTTGTGVIATLTMVNRTAGSLSVQVYAAGGLLSPALNVNGTSLTAIGTVGGVGLPEIRFWGSSVFDGSLTTVSLKLATIDGTCAWQQF